jgi:dihydroorotate dehydrogenase/Pyruvate/2-oxoacid:ferredoxin oxidoreductase delta subunit
MPDKKAAVNPNDIDLSVDFLGHRLQSPYILTSGPLTYGAAGMIRGHEAGAGAVVTKTIRLEAAINPVHHIGTIDRDSLINCEKWADFPPEQYYEKEIPEAVAAGAIVIASVGHTPKEAREIVKNVEKAGAHMIELVSYTEDTMLPMLEFTKNNVNIPVICKLSANWPDTVSTAARCLERGADGLCAIDSIGPTLKIDIRKKRPQMMSDDGYGWLTGAAIRPVVMRINAEIARNHPDLHSLYASGGCMNAEDTVEFLMAGARAVGLCTAPILKGMEYVPKLIASLKKLLAELGYTSLDEVYRAALPNFPKTEHVAKLNFTFKAFKEDGVTKECISCRRCVQVCPYDARTLDFPNMSLDETLCRSCGVCVDVCPTDALTCDIAAQTEADKELERRSKAFNARMAAAD